MRRAIETSEKYYIFMEHCNGGDLKDLFEAKKNQISPKIIHKMM